MNFKNLVALGAILLVLFVILTMTCASAVDNSTDIVKEQTEDMVSINEQNNDNISFSNENEALEVIIENNSSNVNETNNSEVLASTENKEILTVSSSDSVLTSTVTVKYKEPTLKQRTFTIGGFKAVLSKYQYKKLYQISSIEDKFFDEGYNDYYYVGEKFKGYGISTTGLWYSVKVKTNKFIKVKVKIGKKIKYKKTRAYMHFVYGEGQCGIAYRHMVFLTHNYDNPGYDYSKVLGKSAKYFSKCKHNTNFVKLNKSKLSNINFVYKKYSVY
ncbi:MAG: hypothetical protein E7Z81_01620 [Methanobrevibacter sp.]|uniref:hypothetical protein n=1 Tax=Methanobrevibacter sp. TaxID=66852 RepID=UPI0025E27583|nr:hypothetical protein [Methanobrevibacter sp.]MBE6496974.1 hypothetical protein [Methanobrevibacter sp.]